MPTGREWRERDRARDDRELLDRAAEWLRTGPARHEHAGLQHDNVGEALAALLAVLAESVADLDAGVRRQAVQLCRVLLGLPMDSAGIRRTRRR